MRARDQSSIFSTGGKFRPDYGLLLKLHALTLVARSYALLTNVQCLAGGILSGHTCSMHQCIVSPDLRVVQLYNSNVRTFDQC